MANAFDKLDAAISGWNSATPAGDAANGAAMALLNQAECLLASSDAGAIPAEAWHRYLDITRKSLFLKSLPDSESRRRWAQTCFQAILVSRYSLDSLIAQRCQSHPDRVLFQEIGGPDPEGWTYTRIARRLRLIAAALLSNSNGVPRLAIFAENCVDGACCDLACLAYDILVTPLNVHFDVPTLTAIFERLGINTVVTDSDDRLKILEDVQSRVSVPFQAFLINQDRPATAARSGCLPLGAICARLSPVEIEHYLQHRPRRGMTDAATVMFTSGSTGLPKGVCFTLYNLISKRFARAAALPDVDEREVLLCYLPLYHTFGRYLEMMGMLFWGGTYVFSGNPSFDTLIAQMEAIKPTGLISVPIRWSQIRDHCLELMKDVPGKDNADAVFRGVVGGRLRWGLSAAGYLDPSVFRFFQRQGVDLCSGFGMTEATGGITMTPPRAYIDGTVGVPLPGVQIRFSEKGELQIAGPYIARYLPDLVGKDRLPAQDPDEEFWLPTGDLFQEHPGGFLEIVDRIKDIYKNSRGQTIAPRRVEKKFEGVPGIKRSFLSGDGRDYNVLLIVPDRGDTVIEACSSEENIREYFHKIVTTANADLPPYERVVNFDLLERDFELDRGELTPKGSYCRKVIEEHFGSVIQKLYQSDHVELLLGELTVHIPRWFFRDLAILEDDIVAGADHLLNRRSGMRLKLSLWPAPGSILVGDLEYQFSGRSIDLGLFAHQPRLWVGNPELAAFCPCKAGWDLPLRVISERVRLPWRAEEEIAGPGTDSLALVQDANLRRTHSLVGQALFADSDLASAAIAELDAALKEADHRMASLIRGRLETLARHPDERIRCLAYQVLLLDQPMPDYSRAFPSFIDSGLTFLNEDSIRAIAGARLGGQQLEALRQRLYSYRTQLRWPANSVTRKQFRNIFRLLEKFARRHSEYFAPVRAELAHWILHKDDAELARSAEQVFRRLNRWFEQKLAAETSLRPPLDLSRALVFEDGIPASKASSLGKIFQDPTFLTESITLAFGEEQFAPDQIPDGGIWISPILAMHQFDLFRLGINLRGGEHFDLLLVVGGGFRKSVVRETIYWLTALSGHSMGMTMLPRFGACRPDLGAMTVSYVSGLTTWERIRAYSSAQDYRSVLPQQKDWRRLFIRSMAAFFSVWQQSGFRIVPGAVSPTNVVVPEADFREGTCILSLTGWRTYVDALSLVRPLVQNFYRQTAGYYPQSARHLESRWIFDACMEALGSDRGENFLKALWRDLAEGASGAEEESMTELLGKYLDGIRAASYIPLPVKCAIDRFGEWQQVNPHATAQAREDVVAQMFHLYRLARYPEALRFFLYRHTYFRQAAPPVAAAFEKVIAASFHRRGNIISHSEELSDLQAALSESMDREVFSRMVFPRARAEQHLEIVAVGDSEHKQVIVRSRILDRRGSAYIVREPVGPAEIGHLYRLFFSIDPPKTISQQDEFLIATDDQERIAGGISFRVEEALVIYLDAIVVPNSLRGRGIGGTLLEDFCVRLGGEGFKILKTDFVLRRFYTKHGFHVDARWGGLVRFLQATVPDPSSHDGD